MVRQMNFDLMMLPQISFHKSSKLADFYFPLLFLLVLLFVLMLVFWKQLPQSLTA